MPRTTELTALPISNAVYGTDHPSMKPALKMQANIEHLTTIAELIPMRILSKLVKEPRELLHFIRIERRELQRGA